MNKVVVLTGAGMSADSGLSTFRGSGGLWEGYDISEVATLEGWYSNPSMVLDFYNQRRTQSFLAKPNAGHLAVADLEEYFDVTVITQNVDDLHERGGSTNVIHLHGMLREARSAENSNEVIDIGSNKIQLGDKSTDGSQLRPNVVWFGEPVPLIEVAASIISTADVCIVVGTSLVVYPAAGLIDFIQENAQKFIVDPSTPDIYGYEDWIHIKEPAKTGMVKLKEKLIKEYKNG
ncbi:MAG: Sir2 family NAD-dependent protein deacetylase [Balneolaceae bacterium]